MNHIEETLYGRAELEIRGAQPEALLNACAREGLHCRRIRRPEPFCLVLRCAERDRRRIEELALRCQCETSLLSLRGGSRVRGLLRRRLPLLLMAALTLGLLWASSLFVWEIELVGGENLNRGRVLRALEDAGLGYGTWGPGLSADELRSKTLTRLPELVWLTVNLRGSRAQVLLLEREEKPEIWREEDAARVVAARTGVISRLSVLSGKPLVKAGDAVTAGEILVSESVDSLTHAPRLVHARAEVLADTWTERTAVCPAEAAVKSARGLRFHRFALCFGKNRLNLYFHGGKAIDGCDKIVHEYKLGVKGLFCLPLSLVREDYSPYGTEPGPALAARELEQRLRRRLTEAVQGEILSAEASSGESGGVLSVTLRSHCREQIGKTVPVTQAP